MEETGTISVGPRPRLQHGPRSWLQDPTLCFQHSVWHEVAGSQGSVPWERCFVGYFLWFFYFRHLYQDYMVNICFRYLNYLREGRQSNSEATVLILTLPLTLSLTCNYRAIDLLWIAGNDRLTLPWLPQIKRMFTDYVLGQCILYGMFVWHESIYAASVRSFDSCKQH